MVRCALISNDQDGDRVMSRLRKGQLDEVARAECVDRRRNFRQVTLNQRPTCSREHQNGETPRAQVLLTAQVLVRGDDGMERSLSCAEKFAVLEFGPAHLVGSPNNVAVQRVAQRRGRPLVEENFHLGERGGAREFRRRRDSVPRGGGRPPPVRGSRRETIQGNHPLWLRLPGSRTGP
jgi:hypothetical protein